MTKGTGKTEYVIHAAEFRQDWDRTAARASFLLAIQDHAEQVLQVLREQVLPAYRPHHPAGDANELAASRTDDIWHQKVANLLRAPITHWADQFHLRGPQPADNLSVASRFSLINWMGGIIASTLFEWQSDPERALAWGYLPEHSVSARLELPAPFVFETDGWSLLSESAEAFKSRVLSKLKKRIRTYIKGRKKRAQELVSVPSRTAQNHFAYLARYQCLLESHNQIVEHFNKKAGRVVCRRTAVSDGIRKAAEAVIGPSYECWLMPNRPPGRRPAGE